MKVCREYILVRGVIILVIVLNTGEDNLLRMKMQEMPTVLARFCDKKGISVKNHTRIIVSRNSAPHKDGRIKAQLLYHLSNHRGRGRLSMNTCNTTRKPRTGNVPQRFWVGKGRNTPPVRLCQLVVFFRHIGCRVDNHIGSVSKVLARKGSTHGNTQTGENPIRVKHICNITT